MCNKYTKEFLTCSLPLLDEGKSEPEAYVSCVKTDEEEMLYKYVDQGGESKK